MQITNTRFAAVVLAISGLAITAPVMAAPSFDAPAMVSQHNAATAYGDTVFAHSKKRYRGDNDRDYRDYRDSRGRNYDEPVYRNTRVWRGNDGRYYCRKENGTTGLLIGGAVGGLIGNEVAGRGDKTLGVILGAAGGAILGRAIDRSNSRCR